MYVLFNLKLGSVLHNLTDKVIGGLGVNFSNEAHIKVPIAGVSVLFTECQYFARSGKYGSFNFLATILFYSKI